MVFYNGLFESASRRDSFSCSGNGWWNGTSAYSCYDMMWEDGKTVYFLTADFKPLYKRLKEDGRVAVTGMTQGAGTMDRKSISLTGQVEWIGKEHLEELLKANP